MGCSEKTSSGSSSSGTTGSSTAESSTTQEAKPTTVSILLQGDNTPTSDNLVLQELEKRTETSIDMLYVPSADYNTKLSTLIASGAFPDIFACTSTEALEFKEAGILADVGEEIEKNGANILADAGELMTESPVNADGTYYIMSGRRGYGRQINLRTDWLENLNLEMPTDLDSLYNVYRAFTYDDPDQNGEMDTFGLAANADPLAMASIFGAYGIPSGSANEAIVLADGTATTWVKHPDFLEGIGFIRKLIEEGLIEPDWATIANMDMFGKLWNGVAGALEWECIGPTNNWMPARYTEEVPPTFGFPIISGPNGLHGVPAQGADYNRGFVVSSKANVEAAIRIANYSKTLEGSLLLYLGVEGEMFQWTNKEKGEYEYLGEYVDVATHRAAGGFSYWSLFMPSNNAELYTLNEQTKQGVSEAYENMLPHVYVTQPLETWAEYGSELQQVIKEMYVQLLVTTEDLESVYNTYMQEWEVAGGLEWEAELTTLWNASK